MILAIKVMMLIIIIKCRGRYKTPTTQHGASCEIT